MDPITKARFEELVSEFVFHGYDADAAIPMAFAALEIEKWNPDQERDDHGRFGVGGGGGGVPRSVSPSGDVTDPRDDEALVVSGKPKDELDQTEVEPGDRIDSGRKPRSGPPRYS